MIFIGLFIILSIFVTLLNEIYCLLCIRSIVQIVIHQMQIVIHQSSTFHTFFERSFGRDKWTQKVFGSKN
jgi:uncharacterized protein YhhL (DUF1145 family)